jgi:eukaryotic-like serine/threonine-protein kinase
MCRTLAYVHARGIVHRDIKPANVLVSGRTAADLAPKLVDFGIATTVESTSLAVDDATVGTANYLSPERSAHRAG